MKANVIFSGGPDSTAAVLWGIENGYDVSLISLQFKNDEQYGELLSAKLVAKYLDLPHTIIDFKSPLHIFDCHMHIMMHAGSTTDYKKRNEPHLMPFGSGLILTYVASYSLYNDIDTIIWGATKSDAFNSFEYTQDFADKLSELISFTTKKELKVLVPFADKHKPDVIKTFAGKEDLFNLTWSCKDTNTKSIQCGVCKACQARRLAALMAKITDKSEYRSLSFTHNFTDRQIEQYETWPDHMFHVFESEKPPIPA